MQLIAVGESIKNLDKVTGGSLLSQYPTVEWKQVMGMRDILSHHYFDVDAEVVFAVCAKRIPNMNTVIRRMVTDLDENVTSPNDGGE